jgi:hypothetical protein
MLTNRFMLYDMVKVFGWSVSLLYAVVVVSAVVTGNGGGFAFGGMAVVLGLCALALLLLSLVVMAVFFRNRYSARFEIGDRGIGYTSLSRRAHAANRAAVVAGVLAGSAGTAGAGLLAASQESGFWPWSEIRRVNDHPSQRVLSIRNGWRVMVRLYCTPETYADARALLAARLPPGTLVEGVTPRGGELWRSLAIGLCGLLCARAAGADVPWHWMAGAAAFLTLSATLPGLAGSILAVLAATLACVEAAALAPYWWAAEAWWNAAPSVVGVAGVVVAALGATRRGARP